MFFLFKRSFSGGIHPMHRAHEGKLPTRGETIREFAAETVCIPMSMHIGAPSKPCVKPGDHVYMGQVIGEPQGNLGLPVHASVSGEVTAVGPKMQLGAKQVMCVTIKNDFQDELLPEIKDYGDVETVDPGIVIDAVKSAGICGMGGAGFPLHVKLKVPLNVKIDTIILNGAECEVFLTNDFRLMLETPERVVNGLRVAMRALNVKRGVIAIEDNKPEAIEAVKKAAAGREGVEVFELKTKYPQGAEKQIIEVVTGRQVPSGGLPMAVGTVVMNVASAAAVADAIEQGLPLMKRIVTVTGCVNKPSNLLLRIGTSFEDAINQCGGFSEEPGKIISGGAMTGAPAASTDVNVGKTTSGIVVFNKKDAASMKEESCIRCGKCVDACPMGLAPAMLKNYCDMDDLEMAKKLHVQDCVNCGCCSYVCPAHRWLSSTFKNTKDRIALAARR